MVKKAWMVNISQRMGPPKNNLGEKNKRKKHHSLSNFADVGCHPCLQVVTWTQPSFWEGFTLHSSEMYSYSITSAARVATAHTHFAWSR
jgi:hypothetical protein